MKWNDLVYGLGDLFQQFFQIMPIIGDALNWLFILAIFGAIVYWMMQLKKFGNE